MSTLRKFKKVVVAAGLSVTTTVWLASAVLMAPTALAYSDGDLLKDATSSNIYVVNNGMKVWVRSAAVFNDCSYDWAKIKTVSNLSSTLTADLIKSAANPDVYRLEKNFKRKLASTEIFSSYSLDWNKVGTVCQHVLDSYSVAPLIQQTGSPDIYWVQTDTLKHKMTSWQSFVDHGFNIADVIGINTMEMGSYSEGAAVYATPVVTTCTNGDSVCPSGCTSANDSDCAVIPASGLVIALASDNPGPTTTITDTTNNNAQAFIPMLKVNFTAGSDGAATVTAVKFKRGAVPSSDVDFSNFYLYDGSTFLAEYTSISLGVLTFSNTAGLFIVAAGTTKTITLKIDLADALATSRAVSWSLEDATYVSAGSTTVSGSFPLTGSIFTSAAITDLGILTINSLTTYPATIDPDGTEKELWRFNITSSNQKLNIEKITLTEVGTIDITDVQDLRLDISGVQLGTTQQIASDKTITFNNLNYNLLSGEVKTVIVYGKVISGTSRSFKFTIRKLTDVLVKDTNYNNIYLKVNAANTLTVIEPTALAGTTISTGTLTVTRSTTSPSGSIAKGQNAVTLAIFDFKANGEAVKVTPVVVETTLSGDADAENLDNGKLYKVDDLGNEVQIGTTTDLDSDATDDADYTDSAADAVGGGTDDDTSFALGSTFVIPAGKTYKLKVVADTKDGAGTALGTLATEHTLTVSIGGMSATGMTSSSTITPSTATSNQLTLSTYAPTVAENLAMSDRVITNPSGVSGDTNVKIASFVITGGATDADITQISIYDGVTASTSISSLADICQNLKLVKSGDPLTTTIGNIQGTLTDVVGTTYTFTPATALKVTAQGEYIINAYCDIKTGITVADVNFPGAGIIYPSSISYSAGGNSGTITMAAVLQKIYLASGGSLSVTVNGDTPASAMLPMGSSTAYELARFDFTEASGAEIVNVSKIIVTDASTASTDLVDISLDLEGYTGTGVGPLSSFNGASSGTATFNLGSNWAIPAGATKMMKVMAKTKAYGSATAGSQHIITLGAGTSTITARGQSAVTVTVGASITGSTYKVYNTVLTAALGTGSGGSSKTRSTTDTVTKLNLTANPAYPAQLRAGSTVDAITDSLTPTGGAWTAINASTTVAVNTGTPVYGTNAIRFIQNQGPLATEGMKYVYTTPQDWSAYSKLGFWLRSSQTADSIDFSFVDNTFATATTTTAVVAVNTWQYVEVDLDATAANKDSISMLYVVSNTVLDQNDTVTVDNLRLYNDSISLTVAGNLNATVAESGGCPWYLQTSGGTVKATGYFSGTATGGTVILVPDSLISVSSGGITYDIQTNTASGTTDNMLADLVAAETHSMSVAVASGNSGAAGGFRWYDSAVGATLPITWVAAASSSLSSSNVYMPGS